MRACISLSVRAFESSAQEPVCVCLRVRQLGIRSFGSTQNDWLLTLSVARLSLISFLELVSVPVSQSVSQSAGC